MCTRDRPTLSREFGQADPILLVEDDAGHCRTGAAAAGGGRLRRSSSAATAEAALARPGPRPPVDLVLLDYRLPGGTDGLDFYARLKAAGLDPPVILVTGLQRRGDRHPGPRGPGSGTSSPSRPSTWTTCRRPSSRVLAPGRDGAAAGRVRGPAGRGHHVGPGRHPGGRGRLHRQPVQPGRRAHVPLPGGRGRRPAPGPVHPADRQRRLDGPGRGSVRLVGTRDRGVRAGRGGIPAGGVGRPDGGRRQAVLHDRGPRRDRAAADGGGPAAERAAAPVVRRDDQRVGLGVRPVRPDGLQQPGPGRPARVRPRRPGRGEPPRPGAPGRPPVRPPTCWPAGRPTGAAGPGWCSGAATGTGRTGTWRATPSRRSTRADG